MRNRSKLFLAAGVATFVALSVVLLTTTLVAGSLSGRIQRELDARLDAEVRWAAARVGVLRDFPRASLQLDDLVVAGLDRFQADTLLSLDRARLVFDLGSLIRSVRSGAPLEVVRLELVRPSVRLRVLEDGVVNWAVIPSADDEDDGAPASLRLDLQRLRVVDGRVAFDDRTAGTQLRASGMDVQARASFVDTGFRIHSEATAGALSIDVAGMPYLRQARVRAVADVDGDAQSGAFSIAGAELWVNELLLAVTGAVQTGERTHVDLRFNAPRGTLAEIASLVPGFYAAGWQDARAGGTVALDGWIKGELGDDGSSYPAFAATLRVRDGRLQHPDMPLPLSRVSADLDIANPGGDPDATVIDLSRLQLAVGQHPVEGRVSVRTPASDPAISFRAAGTLDLADLPRTFPMDATEIAGRFAVDVDGAFLLSDLDAGRHERVTANGSIAGDAIRYDGAGALPEVLFVDELRLRLSAARAELSSLQARLGASDVTLSGRLDNLLGFVLRDQELHGNAQVTSRRFDLDQWRSDDEARSVPIPARVDLTIAGRVDRLAFADLDLRNVRGALHVKDQRATLQDLTLEIFGGEMAVSGFYETLDPAQPNFDVAVGIRSMQIAEAAAGFLTVQALAPAARYARGSFSTELRLAGVFGPDLSPVLDALDGRGTIEAAGVALEGFPGFARLADAVRVEALRNPTLVDVRSTFSIREGRLHVSPFQLRAGDFAMNVSGSHGFDESLDYRFAFEIPRTSLGAGAGSALSALSTQADRLGVDVAQAETFAVVARMRGSVTQPTIGLEPGEIAPAVAAGVRQQAERRLEAVEGRIDERLAEERRRLDEETARRRADAERRAAAILAEAEALADAARREGNAQADALVAQATNPIARRAAETAAGRLRREAEERAAAIMRAAEARAAQVIAEAERPVDPDAETR